MLICSEKMLTLAKLRTFWFPIHQQHQQGPSWIGTNSLIHLVMLIYSPIKDIFTVVNKTSILTTYFFSKRHQDLCFLKKWACRERGRNYSERQIIFYLLENRVGLAFIYSYSSKKCIQEKLLGCRNTKEKNVWTLITPMTRSFGPKKYLQENILYQWKPQKCETVKYPQGRFNTLN